MPRWAGALTWRCGSAVGKEQAATAMMEFGVLGPLEVRAGSGLVRVPGVKERALLADLVVNAGRVVAADRLGEDLWGEDPPGNPANTLQGRVSALRRSLGSEGSGLVVTRPPGYLLEVAPEQVDAGRFERLGGQGLAGSGTAGLLEEALGLWRGPALAEFADQPWAQAEAARLEELRLGAPPAPGRARRGRRGAAPRGWAGGGGPRAGTPGWSGSWRGWWRPTRPGSGCGASCCWPSTGRAVRPTP